MGHTAGEEVEIVGFDVNIDRLYELQGRTTNKDFAGMLGVTRSQLWRIVTEKSKPGTKFIANFKRAFPDEPIDAIFRLNNVEGNEQSCENVENERIEGKLSSTGAVGL